MDLDGPPTDAVPGITIRDYFAAHALTTFLTKSSAKIWNIDAVAVACYTMADAMVRASEVTTPPPSPPVQVRPLK